MHRNIKVVSGVKTARTRRRAGKNVIMITGRGTKSRYTGASTDLIEKPKRPYKSGKRTGDKR